MRMSWAAPRTTKRPEDMAYCLLGLFGISTPMLYGEGGDRAFMRLQEEIIKESNDMSIFAWRQLSPGIVFYHEDTQSTSMQLRGILANSPAEFLHAHYEKVVTKKNQVPEYAMTNKGLRIETNLKPIGPGNLLLPLYCTMKDEKDLTRTICIILRGQGNQVFARVEPDRIETHNDHFLDSAGVVRHYGNAIYISKRTPTTTKRTTEMHRRVAFRFSYEDLCSQFDCEVIDREPRGNWDEASKMFIMPSNLARFTCFERVAWRSREKASITGEFAIVCGMQPTIEPWSRILTAKKSPMTWPAVEAKDMIALERSAKLSAEKSVVLKLKWPRSETVILAMDKKEKLQGKDVFITYKFSAIFDV